MCVTLTVGRGVCVCVTLTDFRGGVSFNITHRPLRSAEIWVALAGFRPLPRPSLRKDVWYAQRGATSRHGGGLRQMAMFSTSAKIVKPNGEKPDEFESGISQEIEVGAGRKAIIIFVPVPQLKSFQKIQVRLVRELEKKFSGKHVVFIAQRRILPKPTRKSRTKNKQKRPRSRTLTAVHDAILEDLVYPSEIVGRRIRVKLDGSRLIKVHLDKAQQNNVEHKVETFSGVYKKLTGKDVVFEFPEFQL
ncbi:hypothetical protein XELAEV_18028014mg [Xenopus laevis]|uniref:40S ribosomal protein S7 n=1 Tax=Xenopus laevis TaxID=8355 RepID=A0A974HKJ3_XENLA|nr:hypothetical protein XELAEV_18028014mg [Xenopus laevis]